MAVNRGFMMNWHHSGFSVYCGKTLWPDNEDGLESLARYFIRASFSSERMTYIPATDTKSNTAKMIYHSTTHPLKHLTPWTGWRSSPPISPTGESRW
jgi:hypothetical protein